MHSTLYCIVIWEQHGALMYYLSVHQHTHSHLRYVHFCVNEKVDLGHADQYTTGPNMSMDVGCWAH